MWKTWEAGLILGLIQLPQLQGPCSAKNGHLLGVTGHSAQHTVGAVENFGLKSQCLSLFQEGVWEQR